MANKTKQTKTKICIVMFDQQMAASSYLFSVSALETTTSLVCLQVRYFYNLKLT